MSAVEYRRAADLADAEVAVRIADMEAEIATIAATGTSDPGRFLGAVTRYVTSIRKRLDIEIERRRELDVEVVRLLQDRG